MPDITLLAAVADLLEGFTSQQRFILCLVALGCTTLVIVAVGCTWAGVWYQVRKHESEAELTRDLLDQGQVRRGDRTHRQARRRIQSGGWWLVLWGPEVVARWWGGWHDPCPLLSIDSTPPPQPPPLLPCVRTESRTTVREPAPRNAEPAMLRPMLVVLAGACASVGTSLAVWAGLRATPTAYYEVVQDGLVRTNASEPVVNLAVAAVLKRNRIHDPASEDVLAAANYHEAADAWFSKPDLFGATHERASRLVREQVDRQGQRIRIEVLRGVDMATLIFVEHDDPDAVESLARQVATELAGKGVPAG